jgi:hypothetical protein
MFRFLDRFKANLRDAMLGLFERFSFLRVRVSSSASFSSN